MPKKQVLFLGVGLFVFWLLCISLFRNNLGSTVRYFNDDNDRSDYALRGEWFLLGKVPYRDTVSEYPQIPTYLFAIPYLFGPRTPGVQFNYWIYSSVLSFLMLACLGATVVLLFRMLPSHQDRAFLLLLPASLYFAFNRFDILPSFLVLLSFYYLKRGSSVVTGIVLGIATLTKWYPALLFPVFLLYAFHLTRRLDWKMLLAYGLACLAILAPTFLTGGLPAVLEPYLAQGGRSLESISLAALTYQALAVWLGSNLNASVLITIFTALQFIASPLSLLKRIDSVEKVLHWSIVIIGTFILFSRIYSPQWLLWLMPLLILAADRLSDVVWIVLFDVATYLTFPVVFDLAPRGSPLLTGLGFICAAILVRMIVVSIWRTGFQSPFRSKLKTTGG
jgi:hypothetical protein